MIMTSNLVNFAIFNSPISASILEIPYGSDGLYAELAENLVSTNVSSPRTLIELTNINFHEIHWIRV
jgi:hypothetical protein